MSILEQKKFDKISVDDILESIPVGIEISDLDGNIVYGNSTALEILGYNSFEELTEIPMVNFFCNPKDLNTFDQLQKSGYIKNFAVQVKKKDGTKIWILINSEEKKKIKECVSDMMHMVKSRKQTLKADLAMEIFFKVDKLRLSQAITNIISNAIKNTPRKGNIFVNLIEEDNFIDIQVRDTGIGLTDKEKKRLFEKFGKIERYGMDLDIDIEGCGLGLYVTREIVELHGGQILVESEGRHKGATFIIRLFKNP